MYYQEPTFWTAFLLFPESPLLKHCQEPGVGFLTATPYGPLQVASFAALHYWEIPPSQGNVVFSQLFTNMACKRTVWLFQQQWDCIFFTYFIFGMQRQKQKISAHKGKTVKLCPSWEFLYCLVNSLIFLLFYFFLYSFRYTAFQYLQWMKPPFSHENTHPMPTHHTGVFPPASSQCNTPPNPACTRTPWYSHPPLFCLLLFLFNKSPDLACSFLYKCHTSYLFLLLSEPHI